MPKTAITPTRAESFSDWYQQLLKEAGLAEHSPVRGCMVIKPWGYGIWEQIQFYLNKRFKKKQVENAYFPLFIPLSFFQKEATHVDGFATECAVVTHHRLEKNSEGILVPKGELEEPLIVRPTSEMIIGESFSRWIDSYRDLPVKINQWANVVRWEMRTRIFLRTAEFLWQEGHTAHASKEEADLFAREMLEVYREFAENELAIPFITGQKTEQERFPGAETTYTVESIMQDGKALQSGTSHFLGQNFSKAASIQFQTPSGEREYVWTTSWGTTTRLIGALIMTHGDDDGMIVPPSVAPHQVVILPLIHKDETKEMILEFAKKVQEALEECSYHGQEIRVLVDDRDMRGGEKSWNWIKKGIPIRIEIGAREVEQEKVSIKKRTDDHKSNELISIEQLKESIEKRLQSVHDVLLQRAKQHQQEMITEISSKDALYAHFSEKGSSKPALIHWNKDGAIERKMKEELGVTIRCFPDHLGRKAGTCIFTGEPVDRMVLVAKAY